MLWERDQLALSACSRKTARIGQQHECEQPNNFRVVRLQSVDDPGKAYRLTRKVASLQVRSDATRVTLIENEVQDV